MSLGEYLIRTALCLVLLYAVYRVLLENKCRPSVNRLYLLGSFILSFIIPLIPIDMALVKVHSVAVDPLPGNTDAFNTGENFVRSYKPVEQVSHGWSFVMILSLLYFSGILVFMVRFGCDLFRLVRMIKKNEKQEFRNYTLVKLDRPVAPFSFFRYIFIHTGDINSGDFLPYIITHEEAHIRNWHSLDGLFLGLGQVVQWFNPVVLLYKRAVVSMHEYSADNAVIQHSESLAEYQHNLLRYACISSRIRFTNSLSNTMIKKRFMMMTKQDQGRHGALRIVASAIVAAFLLLAFSNGDKIGVKSYPGGEDLATVLAGPDGNVLPGYTAIPDTSKPSAHDQEGAADIQDGDVEDELEKLNREFDRMNHLMDRDSHTSVLHMEDIPDQEQIRRIAEMHAEFGERELRNAERELRCAERQVRQAEEQRILEERLGSLHEGRILFYPEPFYCMPHLEKLEKKQKAREMLKELKPLQGEYYMLPPQPFLFHFRDGQPELQHLSDLQPLLDDQYKDQELRHLREKEWLETFKEENAKMIEEQKKWQEKYHREMDKQREQMEKTRQQLMDEYERMMRKYGEED